MSIKRRRKGKRLRAIGIQRRFTRSQKLRYIVRWIEHLDGSPAPCSKSFAELTEAEKFKELCELKLGIAQVVKSTMARHMLPNGDLRLVIAEYIKSVKGRTKKRSRYHSTLSYYLTPLPDLMKWNKTADIPLDAFSLIEEKLLGRGTYTVRVTQRSLRAFVKKNLRTYAFEDGITDGPVTKHVVTDYYIWLDEEKDLILKALTEPLRFPEEHHHRSLRQRKSTHHSARIASLWQPAWG